MHSATDAAAIAAAAAAAATAFGTYGEMQFGLAYAQRWKVESRKDRWWYREGESQRCFGGVKTKCRKKEKRGLEKYLWSVSPAGM